MAGRRPGGGRGGGRRPGRSGRRVLLDRHRRVDGRQQGGRRAGRAVHRRRDGQGRPALERRQRAGHGAAPHLARGGRARCSTPSSPPSPTRPSGPRSPSSAEIAGSVALRVRIPHRGGDKPGHRLVLSPWGLENRDLEATERAVVVPGVRSPVMAVTDLKLTEWTSCGGCAAKWGGAPLVGPGALAGRRPRRRRAARRAGAVRRRRRLPPVRRPGARVDHRLLPAAGRRPGRLRGHRRRQRLQRRVRHGRPGRARPQRRRLSRAHAAPRPSPPSSTRPPRWWPRRAAWSPAATPSAARSRSSGWPCRALVHPDRVLHQGRRPARRRARAVQADRHRHRARRRWRRTTRRAAIAGHAPAEPGARPRRSSSWAAPSTPSPTSPASACSATRGRWPSAPASGSRSTPRPLPLYDGALAAAEAGVRTGGDARNRAYLDGRVTQRCRDRRSRRSPTTPRRRADCWPRSTPVAVEDLAGAGFVRRGRGASQTRHPASPDA